MQHPECLAPILTFLTRVGITVRMKAVPDDSFLPGVTVIGGALAVETTKLKWPGDLLHEAGHIAVLPSALRHRANEDLFNQSDVEFAGELEAMAWAYAAIVDIGLPIEVLIHDGGYNGRPQALVQMYSFRVYPGLAGLCKAGMTAAPGFTENCGPIHYPRMLRWLRA